MGRKSKYSADFKLMIIHETETSGMTTQLSSEKRLYFKAGINRVTNCMRSNRITSNVRRKKRSRIRRSMTTLKSLKHQFRAQ